MMCLNEGAGEEDREGGDGVEGFDVGEADGDGEPERNGGTAATGDFTNGTALGIVCGGNDVGDGCSSAIVYYR